MMENSQKCSELLKKIEQQEYHEMRKACLQQLICSLTCHQEILTAKLKQLDSTDVLKTENSKTQIEDDNIHANKETNELPSLSSSKETSNKMITSSIEIEIQKSHPNIANYCIINSRQSAIQGTIVQKGQLKFDDVAGLHEAKQALTEAIIMPLQYPHLFTGARKPWRRILLYGPPGTGKSRLAQAVSSEIESTFYCVSSSDLVSSWVGESEKLIKELFHHAQSQPGRSVIFIDEIDSICRKRSSQEEEHTRRIKTELLKQMEGADNAEQAEKIFLLCATNCPWELDSAFLRRFQKRIYIPLPDRAARRSLIQIHTVGSPLQLSESDWQQLVDKTAQYSGSDISAMVLGALFEPIRDLQNASIWHKDEGGKLTPCASLEAGTDTIEATLVDLPADRVQPRDLLIADFFKSMTAHRNTVTPEELDRFQQFTQTFGQTG